MYEHLSQEDREFLLDVNRRYSNARRMPDEIREKYTRLIGEHTVEAITPEGQKVAEPYDGHEHPERSPYIGLWVTYYSRPGEGRNAKTRFPAMVTDVYGIDPRAKRWKVKLMVVWNAVETTDVICLERTEEDRYGAWSYLDDPMWRMLSELSNSLKAIEQRLNGNGRPSPPRLK